MTICYFTASGNCLDVARRIGGTLLSIPQLMREDSIEVSDDVVGIVCPVYAGEMPMMVRDFISRAHIKEDYLFFIYTYGMGYGEAFAHVQLAMEKAGLTLDYISAIQTVDNYLPIFKMQDQIDTLPEKDVAGQIAKVKADIDARKHTPVEITPTTLLQMTMFSRRLAEPILRKETALEYIVNEDCIRCGICAKVCPANNITVTEDGVRFADHCEVCYACLHNCPKNAIHLPVEASPVRYRNDRISLMDIIKSNE